MPWGGLTGDGAEIDALKHKAIGHGAAVAVMMTKTVIWLGTTTPESTDRLHSTARSLDIPIVDTAEAGRRLDAALESAAREALERRRLWEQEDAECQRHRAARDAYWRPTWRGTELTFDQPATGIE